MSERIAVVTGGSGGIGSAVSIKLASEGNHVWIADVDLSGARTSVDRIVAAGGSAKAVSIDVADEANLALGTRYPLVDTSCFPATVLFSIPIMVTRGVFWESIAIKPSDREHHRL